MISEGFTSLRAIPDDFLSAEDPDHRERLWVERNQDNPYRPTRRDRNDPLFGLGD